MRKLLAILAVTAVAVTAVIAPTAGATPKANKDIVATAVAAGQFKTLASLLTSAGLVEDVAGEGAVHGLRSDRCGVREGAEGDADQARRTIRCC